MILRLMLALASLVAGCASQAPAPVIERSTASAAAPAIAEVPPGFYVVRKGDTLHRIALDHGQDYKDVIAWNKLDNPNRIEVGQQLRVAPPEGAPVAVVRPVVASTPVEVKAVAGVAAIPVPPVPTAANTAMLKQEPKGGKLPYSEENLARLRAADGAAAVAAEAPPVAAEKPASTPSAAVPDAVDWAWPAMGKLLAGFSEGGAQTNKGLDIAGKSGDPVLAAAAGKVVYVGNSLRGYGNLIIVRHNATFLSAYAHNSRILAKEGQAVTRGQKIAEVGSSDTDQPKLHFEIRRQGKPVDPAQYLPPR
jgi:lipoprotein NlpD